MKENILVSIICITYNHEKYIRYALEGFLKQKTNFKFEILIHDDASTDSTVEILKEYEKKYSDKIKVIYQKENQYSQGKDVSKILWKKASGKYFAFCEGDDYWIDDKKLQKQIDFLEKNREYIATYHNVLVVDKDNKKFLEAQDSFPIKEEQDFCKENYIPCSLPGQLASLVCRNFYTEMLKDNLDYEEYKTNGDVKLAAYLIYKGKVKNFKEVMACYRRTYDGDSWNSRIKNKNLLEYMMNSCLEIKRMIKDIFDCNIDINEKIRKLFWESVIFFLKKPSKENLEISYNILKKVKEKRYLLRTLLLKLLKSLFRVKRKI